MEDNLGQMQDIVYGIYCHMRNSVIYPILRHMLGYTDHQQISPLVLPCDTWCSSVLTNISMSMLDSFVRCISMLHNGLQVD